MELPGEEIAGELRGDWMSGTDGREGEGRREGADGGWPRDVKERIEGVERAELKGSPWLVEKNASGDGKIGGGGGGSGGGRREGRN